MQKPEQEGVISCLLYGAWDRQTLKLRRLTDLIAFRNRRLADSQLRRFTPRECERLQGFPDDWTKIPWRNKPAEQCPDGLRYKGLR